MLDKRIVLLILIGLLVPSCFGLNYWLDSANGNYEIQKDGTVYVSEIVIFGFKGNLNYVYKDIDYDRSNGEELEVDGVYLAKKKISIEMSSYGKEELDYQISNTGEGERIKILFDGSYVDGYYSVIFEYKLKGVVEKWDDVGQFYWKVWGENWDKKLPLYQGKIILPAEVEAKEVYTWGHPAKDGTIKMLDNRTIGFEAYDIKSGEWLEIRVVFPSRILGEGEVDKKIGMGLEKIIEEEENYGKMSVWEIFYIFLILGGLGLFLGTLLNKWWKNGRDPEIEYNAEYERDIPFEYSPAIVSGLLKEDKKPKPDAILSVILDLSFRGFLKLKKIEKKKKILFISWDKEDYEIIFKKKDGLTKQEKMIYEMLEKISKDGKKTSFKEIEEYFKGNSFDYIRRKENKEWMEDWQDEIKKEIKKMKLLKENKFSFREILFCCLGAIVGFIGFFLFAISAQNEMFIPLFFMLGSFVLILGILIYAYMPSRTKEGVLHYKKWKGLEKFLKDYSLIKEKPPESIVLWEKYLIYATALGCADKVAEAMKLILPEKDFARSAIFVGTVNSNFYSSFSSLGNSFSSALAAGTGTAGSGGFGAGGGGAGGGGGGGAG